MTEEVDHPQQRPRDPESLESRYDALRSVIDGAIAIHGGRGDGARFMKKN